MDVKAVLKKINSTRSQRLNFIYFKRYFNILKIRIEEKVNLLEQIERALDRWQNLSFVCSVTRNGEYAFLLLGWTLKKKKRDHWK